MADEAEEGLGISKLRDRPGGRQWAPVRPIRSGAARAGASPGADKRAAQDETTASEIVREALRRYVKVTEQIELVSGRRPCDVSLAIEARLVR